VSYRDDFAHRRRGWVPETYAAYTTGYFRDTFRIWLKKPYNAVQTGKGFNRVKALKLDVDVRSPAVARRDPEFQQGIACGRFSDGYLLVITPGSGPALIRHQHNEVEETIATAFPPNAIKKPPPKSTICGRSAAPVTTLQASDCG